MEENFKNENVCSVSSFTVSEVRYFIVVHAESLVDHLKTLVTSKDQLQSGEYRPYFLQFDP